MRHPDQEVLVSWTKNLVRLNLPIFHFLDDVFVVTRSYARPRAGRSFSRQPDEVRAESEVAS